MIDKDPTLPPAEGTTAEVTRMILEGLRTGATVADLKGIDSNLLEGIYAMAHRSYENGELEDAETFFRFLCLYDFYNAEYALGLGAVLQLQREFEKAIGMYAVAQTLDLQDDRAMFHVGQCHLALGRRHKARECFSAVATRAQGTALQLRAEAYLKVVTDPAEGDAEEAPGDLPDFVR